MSDTMMIRQSMITPFEWDPSNPSCLLLPVILEDEPQSLRTIRHFVVSDGTCSDYELTALLKILTVHFDHHRLDREMMVSKSEDWKNLSREYRRALKESLDSVQNDDAVISDDPQNIQLLHHIYATLHLSEIFIPLTSVKWEHENPFSKPGYVTADTVRYLRRGYAEIFTLRSGAIVPDTDLDLMYGLDQPDKFRSDDGTFYWEYMEYLVRTGRLEEAVELLLRHSLYTTTKSEDLKREFLVLCSFLLVAPIPGGRNRNNDDGLEAVTFGDEDFLILEEGPTVTDIGTEDFKHWETGINQDIHFSSYAAVNAHRTWQDKITRLSLPTLHCYLPRETSEILNILSGNSLHTADSAAMQLLEELLYKNPNWTPAKVAARASGLGLAEYDTNIMHGDVSEALNQLNLGGSSSGAALPSTLYSLIVSLYYDAGVLSENWNLSGCCKTALLCNAAYDIVTSLSDHNPDIGAQQAVRLLLPYALKERNTEYVASIATILGSYQPTSDDYARTIISLCQPLIDRKSMEVLQGCTDVLLCRFDYSNGQENFDDAVSVLVEGLGLEAKVYPSPCHGSCFRAINARCSLLSAALIESLLTSEPNDESIASHCLETCSYLSAFDDPRNDLDLLKFPHVSQLCAVWALFDAIITKEPMNVVTDRIAECFEGPSAKSLVPRLHDDLVLVLKKFIDAKDKDRFFVRATVESSEHVKPTTLKWAELAFLGSDGDCELDRICLDEFVCSVVAKNSERLNSPSTFFGSSTNMGRRPNRPFNELSDVEKRAYADYLNKKFDIPIDETMSD